jgi:hypothetical protein
VFSLRQGMNVLSCGFKGLILGVTRETIIWDSVGGAE